MAATHTVVRGDTLSEIAQKYKAEHGTTDSEKANTYVYLERLLKLNPDIVDRDKIYVGQVIVLSGTAATKTKATAQKAVISGFGLFADDNTYQVYATWTWTKSNTDHYKVKWVYGKTNTDGKVVRLVDTGATTEINASDPKQSLYSITDDMQYVDFYVKPVSKTYKSGKKEVSYWTADWSNVKRYNVSSFPPLTPSSSNLSIKLEGKKLSIDFQSENSNLNSATSMQFQILRHDGSVYKLATKKLATDSKTNITSASYSCTVESGGEYTVRCRSEKNSQYSDWSEQTDSVFAAPDASEGIYEIKSVKDGEVEIRWHAVENVDNYEIQHTNDIRYFDANPAEVTSVTIDGSINYAIITGLVVGEERFFRVRANIEKADEPGAWSEIQSLTLGKKPSPPTTWSSSTTVKEGEDLYLYWVHNSVDASSETFAQLEYVINGGDPIYPDPIPKSPLEEEKDKTSYCFFDTSSYTDGAKIQWRVKTAGIYVDEEGDPVYSDWSVQRDINVYKNPTVALIVTNASGEEFTELETLPINITAVPDGGYQKPIGYYLSVVNNDSYETVDEVGNVKIIGKNSTIYSNYFDTNDYNKTFVLSANDLTLVNNVSYTIKCVVAMDSGLSAEESYGPFTVAWSDEDSYWPTASIGYDSETYTTFIRPYCEDENEQLVEGVTLSVYRREFDGTFTEIGTNLPNSETAYVTDPHPSLDYARYRIVATKTATGEVSYYDVPGYPIEEKAIIMQWDEEWSNFDIDDENVADEPSWTGSLLKLPYNIDITDSNDPDVSFVSYIGREHPVSYYGTHIGQSSVWNVSIDKNDVDTLYALRRLSRWMGNVYVREPSGSGYWANVGVTFNQKHRELTIPVTFNITRVEGDK